MELETVEDMVTTLDAAAEDDEVDEVGEGTSASLDFIAVESFSRFQLDITGFSQLATETTAEPAAKSLSTSTVKEKGKKSITSFPPLCTSRHHHFCLIKYESIELNLGLFDCCRALALSL